MLPGFGLEGVSRVEGRKEDGEEIEKPTLCLEKMRTKVEARSEKPQITSWPGALVYCDASRLWVGVCVRVWSQRRGEIQKVHSGGDSGLGREGFHTRSQRSLAILGTEHYNFLLRHGHVLEGDPRGSASFRGDIWELFHQPPSRSRPGGGGQGPGTGDGARGTEVLNGGCEL